MIVAKLHLMKQKNLVWALFMRGSFQEKPQGACRTSQLSWTCAWFLEQLSPTSALHLLFPYRDLSPVLQETNDLLGSKSSPETCDKITNTPIYFQVSPRCQNVDFVPAKM